MAKHTSGFFTIDNQLIDLLAPHIGLNGIGMYSLLKRHCNQKTRSCFPSYSTLAKKSGCTKKTAIKLMAKLEEHNLISKETRKNPSGDFISNMYRFCAPEEWVLSGVKITPPGVINTLGVVNNLHQGGVKITPKQDELNKTNFNNTHITSADAVCVLDKIPEDEEKRKKAPLPNHHTAPLPSVPGSKPSEEVTKEESPAAPAPLSFSKLLSTYPITGKMNLEAARPYWEALSPSDRITALKQAEQRANEARLSGHDQKRTMHLKTFLRDGVWRNAEIIAAQAEQRQTERPNHSRIEITDLLKANLEKIQDLAHDKTKLTEKQYNLELEKLKKERERLKSLL